MGGKVAEDNCQGRDTVPRGTFLVQSQVLLIAGFIPCNAKHQKATQKETDIPKAQPRWGLGISQYLSLEEAMALKSLQPGETNLALRFSPSLFFWFLLEGPAIAHHSHTYGLSGEVQPCRP